jgi:hypothetical protein
MDQHKMSNEELRDLMDEEARAAEAAAADDEDDGAPLPPDVKVSRPNRARSKVLQVRLNPDEMEAVEAIAARRDLPPSTVAREWLLRMIEQDQRQGAVPSLSALAQTLLLATEQLHDIDAEVCRALPGGSTVVIDPLAASEARTRS